MDFLTLHPTVEVRIKLPDLQDELYTSMIGESGCIPFPLGFLQTKRIKKKNASLKTN